MTLRAVLLGLALLASACSDATLEERPPIFVTADWLNRSVTVFSQEKLLDGSGSLDDAIVGRIDLAPWAPGPIQVEVTPDGETAIVAVGPGFFQSGGTNALIGGPDVPNGSAILLIDLDAFEVTTAIEPRHAPLGIAISPDGRRAYTANYGQSGARGDSVSVIDLETGRLIEEFSVGGRPEQIAIDPDGRFAIVNLVGASGVRLFDLSDPVGTLSDVVETGGDPSDAAFLADATRAVVANSGGIDHTLLDTSNPSAAFAIQSVRAESGVPYGVTYMPGRDQILAPTGVPATLVVLSRSGDTLVPGKPVALLGAPFPMTAVSSDDERHALIPHMSTQTEAQLSIVDLDGSKVRGVSWLPASGPAYIAAWP